MVSKIQYPPGTVVQYRDEFCDGDRSYRVVFRWDQENNIVEAKLNAAMGNEHVEMEKISTEKLKVIAYCDAEGNVRAP